MEDKRNRDHCNKGITDFMTRISIWVDQKEVKGRNATVLCYENMKLANYHFLFMLINQISMSQLCVKSKRDMVKEI